jgi:hypothetical protein
MAERRLVREDRRGVWPAAVAAALIGCVFLLYLAIIIGQSDAEVARVAFVGILMSGAAACCLATAFLREARPRVVAACAGAGALLSLGVLGIFSVGLPLLVSCVLMVVAIAKIGMPAGSGARAAAAFLVGALVPWSLLLL